MSQNFFKYDDVEWSLPLLFQYEPVYGTLYKMLQSFGIKMPRVNLFGSPTIAWTGGRAPAIYGEFDAKTLLKVFKYVKNLNATPVFTFSCTNISDDDLKDNYANYILDIALEAKARFIVYSDKLKNYIKEKDPNAFVVASVIKPALRFQGPTRIEEPTIENETNYYNELLKDYDVVVVRPEYSRDVLSLHPEYIDDISRVEVLINQPCINNCPRMPEHYRFLETSRVRPNVVQNFECVRKKMPNTLLLENNLIHSSECVSKLVKAGCRRLKLQGRGISCPTIAMLHLIYEQIFNQTIDYYLIENSLTTVALEAEINSFSREIGDQGSLSTLF